MTLSPGTRLGPYEIVAPLGAGGMGDVYRARDTRLGRDVAVKVLPAELSADGERLRRFEQEARAASALNHPNILTVFDVGTRETPYVVSELLEGETLRQRLAAGALPRRKAVEYGLQIARGLAAAHEKGIVHRDLKPENLFVTNDGRVKILDFGLAKLTRPEAAGATSTEVPTLTAATEPGTAMGTVGYMSPEQVVGKPADHRSDLFAFGAVLYEMLTGRRAFRGSSAVETMNAILKEEPPAMSAAGEASAPALEGLVRHCLEKNPEERFHSARDLAFALEPAGAFSGSLPAAGASQTRRPRATTWLAAGVGAAVLLAAAFLLARRTARVEPPSFQLLTYRRGTVRTARFAPDGQTVVYGAQWEGKPSEVFTNRPGSAESRSLGLPAAELLAVSRSGEMALSVENRRVDVFRTAGTLAQAPLSGGAPREILKDVFYADWSPDGKGLAVVRSIGGRSRLEFPIGKTLFESAGWLSHPRFSPNGDAIAFLEHPEQGNDLGSVAVVDLAGHKKKLGGDWGSAEGLAWSPGGEEIWFAASEAFHRALHGVDLEGRDRLIARAAGSLTLLDVSAAGRVLVNRESWRGILNYCPPREGRERELSWLDTSCVTDISIDGKTLLFGELGEAGGALGAAYLRPTDGSPAVRLGDGWPTALSPDGTRVLAIVHGSPTRLMVLPTGAGQGGELSHGAIVEYHWATFFPDGMRVLFAGNEAGHGARLYEQDMAGGAPRAVAPEGIAVLYGGIAIAPDGGEVATVGPDDRVWLYPLARSGEGRLLPGLPAGYSPIRWTADGRSLFVYRPSELPARVLRVSAKDGHTQVWKTLMPSDAAGVTVITPLVIAPDAKSYAYTFVRSLSDLYLVEGWK